jgi:hypothetical protein
MTAPAAVMLAHPFEATNGLRPETKIAFARKRMLL